MHSLLSDNMIRYALLAIFAGAMVWHGWRAVRADSAPSRGGHLLEVVMAVAMAAMLGPWHAVLPPVAAVVVFAPAALWFADRALLARSPRAAYHAAEMAAMVWMSTAMSLGDMHESGGHDGHMAGMRMADGPAPVVSPSALPSAVSAGLAVLFLAAAAGWLGSATGTRLFRGGPQQVRASTVDTTLIAATSAAMAVSLLALQ